MGSLGILNLSSWNSTSNSFHSSSSTMPLGDNHGRPHAIFGDSATHFAVRRFKSTEAERESDAEYINQDGGDQVLLFFMLVLD